jgi:Domain of unknown function (DUF4340)
MRRCAFRLLWLTAAALAVVAAVVLSRGDRAVSRAPPGGRALPGLADKLGDLAWLRLTRGATTVNFALINRQWDVVEKGNYPADQERIRKLLVQLAEVELVEPKTDKAELLPRLDLDDPANGKATLITAQDRTGELAGQLIVGRRRPTDIGGDAGVYVRRPGSDQAWLARGTFDLGGGALNWVERRVIDVPPRRVSSVVLTAADGSAVTIARGSIDLPLALDGAPSDVKPKDDIALAAPAGALEALGLIDVKPAAEQPIPQDGLATAAFTTYDGLIFGLRLAPPGTGDWVAIEVTGFGNGEEAAKTLNARLAPWTFQLPPDRVKLLRTKLADLVQAGGS